MFFTWKLIFYLILAAASIFAPPADIVSIDCKSIPHLHLSTHVMYHCNNDNSLIIHSTSISFPGYGKEGIWLQMEQGALKKKRKFRHMSSCLSTIRGSTASKSVTSTKAVTGIVVGDMRAPFFDTGVFKAVISPSLNIHVRLETQAEYKCDAVAGEVLQILLIKTEYSLIGWRARPITELGNFESGEWTGVPDTVIGEFNEVACVSTPHT